MSRTFFTNHSHVVRFALHRVVTGFLFCCFRCLHLFDGHAVAVSLVSRLLLHLSRSELLLSFPVLFYASASVVSAVLTSSFCFRWILPLRLLVCSFLRILDIFFPTWMLLSHTPSLPFRARIFRIIVILCLLLASRCQFFLCIEHECCNDTSVVTAQVDHVDGLSFFTIFQVSSLDSMCSQFDSRSLQVICKSFAVHRVECCENMYHHPIVSTNLLFCCPLWGCADQQWHVPLRSLGPFRRWNLLRNFQALRMILDCSVHFLNAMVSIHRGVEIHTHFLLLCVRFFVSCTMESRRQCVWAFVYHHRFLVPVSSLWSLCFCVLLTTHSLPFFFDVWSPPHGYSQSLRRVFFCRPFLHVIIDFWFDVLILVVLEGTALTRSYHICPSAGNVLPKNLFSEIDAKQVSCLVWMQDSTYPNLFWWNLTSASLDCDIFIFLPLNFFS